MYLKSNDELKTNTNINSEFEPDKPIYLKLLEQFKLPLIILGIIILIIILFFVFKPKKEDKITYAINLKGNVLITIYKGEEFIEPGFSCIDNKNNDVTSKVEIDSNLNTAIPGEYKINYHLNDVVETRYIKVIDKPVGATYIYLKGDNVIYLKVNHEYEEPGYVVIDSVDQNIADKIQIDNNVNTKKAGIYKVVYSVTNSSGITTQAKRDVIVVDSNLSVIADTKNYTNKNIDIKIYATDSFKYLILPDGRKITDNKYTYSVSENGEYKFTSYDEFDEKIEKKITINNIDKEKPTGACSGSYGNNQTNIKIEAKDNIGISKYIIDGATYYTNNITINKNISYANIIVYDKAGNTNNITCNLSKIEVAPVDNKPPTGTCSGTYENGQTKIVVNAQDESGIKKYSFNGNTQTSNIFIKNGELKEAKVTIYDNYNNKKEIKCTISKPAPMPDSKPTPQPDMDTDTKIESEETYPPPVFETINLESIGCNNVYYGDSRKKTLKINTEVSGSFKDILRNTCRYAKNSSYMSGKLHTAGTLGKAGDTGYHGRGFAIDLNNNWQYIDPKTKKKYTPYASMGRNTWNNYQKFICEECGGKENCAKNINYQIYQKFFEPKGWCWGGYWNQDFFDPMHYEYTGKQCDHVGQEWIKYRIKCN